MKRTKFLLPFLCLIVLFVALLPACNVLSKFTAKTITTTLTSRTTIAATVPSSSTTSITSTNSSISTPLTTTQATTNTTKPLLEVYFIDVGQGDCEIVRYQDAAMIVDAGTNATATSLVNTIKSMGISKFDVAIGTHPHEDQIGGLDAVINSFSIGTLYMPKVTTTTKTFMDVLTAIKNKSYTITAPVPGWIK